MIMMARMMPVVMMMMMMVMVMVPLAHTLV